VAPPAGIDTNNRPRNVVQYEGANNAAITIRFDGRSTAIRLLIRAVELGFKNLGFGVLQKKTKKNPQKFEF